jgi:hypothetical protein
VKHFAPILVVLLVPTLAAAQDLSEEQVHDLKTLRSALETVDRLEQAGTLTADLAERYRRDQLELAGKVSGQVVPTRADLDELIRQNDRSRFWGFFTFINIVAVFAGVLLALALSWLFAVYLGPFLMTLPPVAWEFITYGVVALGMFSGAIWPVLGIWFVVPAALLLIGALSLTRHLHFPPPRPGDANDAAGMVPGQGWVTFTFSEFTALVCAIVWGIAAIYYRSYLLGFLTVMALQALLGFSAFVIPGCVGLGFRKEDGIPRATLASFVLLVVFVVLQITGQFEPVREGSREVSVIDPRSAADPRAPLVYFRPGAIFMGAFVYFLGLLLLATRFYSGSRGNYLLMQAVTIVSGVAAFYFGATFGIDALLGIGGTFFVLYLLEKYTELPWKDIGWAWGLLGFAALLYAAAYLAGHYPQYFLLGVK